MKPATSASAILLAVIAAVHLLRLIAGVDVTVGETPIPVWASAVGVVLPGGLAFGIWREHRPAR